MSRLGPARAGCQSPCYVVTLARRIVVGLTSPAHLEQIYDIVEADRRVRPLDPAAPTTAGSSTSRVRIVEPDATLVLLVFLRCSSLPLPAFAFKARVVDQQGRPVAERDRVDPRPHRRGRHRRRRTIRVAARSAAAVRDPGDRCRRHLFEAGDRSSELDAEPELVVTVAPLVSESVTVSGSAPSIEATPARRHDERQRPRRRGAAADEPDAGARERRRRQPGVRRTGGGAGDSRAGARPHADPDRRRARQLRAPRRAERHLSRSRRHRRRRRRARARDRSPTVRMRSAASSRCGRAASRRVRRWRRSFSGTIGAGIPEQRGARRSLEGRRRRRRAVRRAHARRRRLGQPRRARCSTRASATTASSAASNMRPARGTFSASAGRATSAATSSGRATTRRRCASTIRPKTRIASPPATTPRDVGGFSAGRASPAFSARYAQVTDQDRFATATTGRSIERADVAAKDFHVRGFGERLFGTVAARGRRRRQRPLRPARRRRSDQPTTWR